MNKRGWPVVAVAGAMIAVVAATVFKTADFDNVVAWLFIGAALVFAGAWLAIYLHNDFNDQHRHYWDEQDREERDRRE